jgi:outer membrane protein
MKRMIKGFVPVLMLFFCTSVLAESATIGVVNIQKIMQSAPEVKVVREKLEKEFKPRQENLMGMEQSLKADMDKLKRDASIMSKSQKSTLEQKIMQSKRNLERKGQDYQQDLNMAQNQSMEKVFVKVRKAIDSVAKEKGYDIVLQSDSVPYNSSKVDITDSVLKNLK